MLGLCNCVGLQRMTNTVELDPAQWSQMYAGLDVFINWKRHCVTAQYYTLAGMNEV